MYTADKRYYADADGNLVAENDPKVAVMVAAKGTEVPLDTQKKYGLGPYKGKGTLAKASAERKAKEAEEAEETDDEETETKTAEEANAETEAEGQAETDTETEEEDPAKTQRGGRGAGKVGRSR